MQMLHGLVPLVLVALAVLTRHGVVAAESNEGFSLLNEYAAELGTLNLYVDPPPP